MRGRRADAEFPRRPFLPVEHYFALFVLRRELLSRRQVFLDSVADILQCLLFGLALRCAAGQAGDPDAETVIRFLERYGVASVHTISDQSIAEGSVARYRCYHTPHGA